MTLKVVVVDGIIGAGKTTYINMLTRNLTHSGYKVTIVKEPVEKWKSSGLLEKFYTDQSRWGSHFQMMAFVDRVNENRRMYDLYIRNNSGGDKSEKQIFILERSPFTDILFMELLHETGKVDDMELDNYREWIKMWRSVMPYEPDIFIYLKPDLDICMNRLHERNRKGEEGIPRDYQQKLQAKHDNFFNNDCVEISESHFVPCITLNTNENFRDDERVQKELTDHFKSVVEKFF